MISVYPFRRLSFLFPLFLLSGAMLPHQRLPKVLYNFAFLDPLTYGVDGLRASLVKFSIFSRYLDLAVISVFALVTIIVGAYLFEKMEAY